MSPAEARRLLALVALAWTAALLLAPHGLFTIDEAIQLAGLRAVAETGRFTVENGWHEFGHGALRLRFLRVGPDGLVPQYPGGFALLAAPAWALGGLKGAMALNLAAAIGLLAITWALGRALFDDPRVGAWGAVILALGSFLAEYAVALWPHALAAAASAGAALLAVSAVERDRAMAAGAAGAVIGLGMTLRLDVVLALPGIAVWLALVAPRPIASLAWLGGGLLPGLALASLVNLAKFGTLLPLSYGADVPADATFVRYAGLAALMLSGFGAILLWRLVPALCPAPALRAPLAVALGLGALALALAIAETRAGLSATLRGLWVLGVDLRDTLRLGVEPATILDEEGRFRVAGALKKSLGQSLPWIGGLVALALLPGPRRERRGIWLALLMVGAAVLPFLPTEWHGGFSHNLRYFLAALPWLSLLAAVVLLRLSARIGRPGLAELSLPALALAVAVAAGLALAGGAATEEAAGQILPPWLLGATALAALGLGIAPLAATAARALRVLIFAGLALAGVLAYGFDLRHGLTMRAWSAAVAEAYRDLPGPALLVAYHTHAQQDMLARDDVVVALWNPGVELVSPALMREALASGRRVFSQTASATAYLLARDPALVATDHPGLEPYLVEITLPES